LLADQVRSFYASAMPDTPTIRLATHQDLEACVNIQTDSFHIFTTAKRRTHLQKMITLQTLLVMEDQEQIIAYASFDPDWFGCTFLKLVVVDSAVQRQGFASRLIRYIEDYHCPSGRLLSSTEDDNLPSKALHQQLEFKVSGWLDNLPQPHREIFYFKTVD